MSALRHQTKFVASIPGICTRLFSSAVSRNDEISPTIRNRNPRNLEKMTIGYKPDGYHVDMLGHKFWHKLELTKKNQYITASIVHFDNGEVVTASTSEWAIKKQLYKGYDTSAYLNLARVLAQRCLQSGILEVSCFITPVSEDGKLSQFLKKLQECGVTLKEPEQYKHRYITMPNVATEKPWKYIE